MPQPVVSLVLGAGGFIGSWLVKDLVAQGQTVIGFDHKEPQWSPSPAQHFHLGDATDTRYISSMIQHYRPHAIYQLATDMGGAGYIFTGEHDAQVMRGGTQIHLNVLEAARQITPMPTVFLSSSACIYPHHLQAQGTAGCLEEWQAYPANPDSEYGWEKLYAERLYGAYHHNHGLPVRIARFHSIVGPEGTYKGGREKVFAALARKVAEAPDGGSIEVWGDGTQQRTFLHVQDCVRGIRAIMEHGYTDPFNLGSTTPITIGALAELFITISGKQLTIQYIPGPRGVQMRAADVMKLQTATGWQRQHDLQDTAEDTYRWVAAQVAKDQEASR